MAKQRKFYRDILTEDMVRYYLTHIPEFVQDLILYDSPDVTITDQQRAVLEETPYAKRLAVRSGRGCGKTGLVAWTVLWFLATHANPKIILTSPSRPQLESALLPELSKWLSKSAPLSEIFECTATRIYLKENPKNWFCMARTASKGSEESMSGLHEDNMLLIVDEASAVDELVYSKLEATMSKPENKIILISNPTRTSGPFYDAHVTFKHRWKTFHFSSEESPICDREQIEYMEAKYGRGSDKFRVDVLGEFPSGDPDCFITLEQVDAAKWREVEPSGDIQIGVDVARFGDDKTVLCWRWGLKVYPLRSFGKTSIDEVIAHTLKLVEDIRSGAIDARTKEHTKTIRIVVDDGGLGAGVTDMLKLDRTHNIEVIPANFGGKGTDEYEREGTAMWATVRDLISQIDLPDDRELLDELCTRRYSISYTGKMAIEPKKDYKKRCSGKSPDSADALVLAFSNKSSDRVVLKDFDPLDKSLVGKVHGYLNGDTYTAINYAKDLLTCILHTVWDGNRLYVLDEYICDGAILEIATNIKTRTPPHKILGNKLMFNKESDDLRTQFKKMQIYVRENFRYDDYGAIQALSKLIGQKRIYVAEHCTNTIQQLHNWKMDGNKSKQNTDYGLCYALCNIVSDLKNQNKLEPPVIAPFPAYSGERDMAIKNLHLGAKLSRKNNKWLGC